MTDERLAWLAVRDHLSRKARRGSVLARWLGVDRRRALMRRDGTIVDSGGAVNEMVSGRLRDYALAVDDVAQRLTAEERQVLRETGALPGWFIVEVERQVAELRRQR
jgi:hypothetical protein